ncbi:hypothetical protein, partial [Eikenella corrodens]
TGVAPVAILPEVSFTSSFDICRVVPSANIYLEPISNLHKKARAGKRKALLSNEQGIKPFEIYKYLDF